MTDIEFYNFFTFTHFSFSKEKINKIDSAGGNFIALLFSGSAILTSKKDEIVCKAGDVLFIPKRLKYQSRWLPDEQGEVSFLSLKFENFPDSVSKNYSLQKINCSENDKEFLRFIDRNIGVNCDTIGALYSFLGKVQNKMISRRAERNEFLLEQALEFIENHTDCTVSDIASHCRKSETAIYNLFKEKLGETPTKIKQKIMCRKATELLHGTDLKVEDISEKIGFSSSIYFRKILKQQTGKTPLQIRRELRF